MEGPPSRRCRLSLSSPPRPRPCPSRAAASRRRTPSSPCGTFVAPAANLAAVTIGSAPGVRLGRPPISGTPSPAFSNLLGGVWLASQSCGFYPGCRLLVPMGLPLSPTAFLSGFSRLRITSPLPRPSSRLSSAHLNPKYSYPPKPSLGPFLRPSLSCFRQASPPT